MHYFDFRRISRSGLLNFWRNGFVSLSSVLVMSITIAVISSVVFFQAILSFTLTQLEDKVDVTVYFTPQASEAGIFNFREKIEAIPEVKQVTYVSAEDALNDFRERHKDDYLTIQALEELNENPLGGSLLIKAQSTDDYETISNFFDQGTAISSTDLSLIDKVNYNENKQVIERILSLKEGAKRLGLIVSIILVAISIVITFNTIRLTIYMAREEIGVMRLVGAEDAYIHGPFIVEGVFYGVIATVINILVFIPLTYWMGGSLENFFGINLFTYYMSNFFQIFIISLLTGIALGTLSSFLAVQKYLKR